MKFGGTSVGDAQCISRAAALVAARSNEKPVVVVSAVGGITNLMLLAGEKARQGISAEAAVKKIKEIHLQIAEKFSAPTGFIEEFCNELSQVYEGIRNLGEFTPRTRDLTASFGERLSARLFAACLNRQGAKAKAFDSWEIGFITSGDFMEARLLPESEKKIKEALSRLNEIPIITGFIGKDSQGNITTLGRGGSDLTASLIGAAIGAERIEIWTDVSGIMSADPRTVPDARPLPVVSFQEAAELAYFGAKILHPKTIEPAMKKKIPVLVKNTFSPEDPGTTIVAANKSGFHTTAITSKNGITGLNLYSTGMLDAHGFLAKVFAILEKHGLSVDVVTTSEVNVSLTLDNAENLDAAVGELSAFAEVSVEKNLAIVCLVSEGLKETPGIAGRAFRILGEAGINVEMISQGASQINLTCVVKSPEAAKAVRALHGEFIA